MSRFAFLEYASKNAKMIIGPGLNSLCRKANKNTISSSYSEGGHSMERLPKSYESFSKKYPKAWKAYDGLPQAYHQAGPLDEKNRALVKLAMAIGAKMER
jgi:hypothetical protein